MTVNMDYVMGVNEMLDGVKLYYESLYPLGDMCEEGLSPEKGTKTKKIFYNLGDKAKALESQIKKVNQQITTCPEDDNDVIVTVCNEMLICLREFTKLFKNLPKIIQTLNVYMYEDNAVTKKEFAEVTKEISKLTSAIYEALGDLDIDAA